MVRVALPVGEALSVALMALAILSCLAGSDDPNRSFGTIYFWVVWWVCLGIVATHRGRPLRLALALGRDRAPRAWRPRPATPGAYGRMPYPPASGAGRPRGAASASRGWSSSTSRRASRRTLGLLLLAYSVVALVLPLVIGIDAWQRCVDPFGVLARRSRARRATELRALPEEPCEACALAEPEPAPLRIDCASLLPARGAGPRATCAGARAGPRRAARRHARARAGRRS